MNPLPPLRLRWPLTGLLILWLAACHDAPRTNPLDPDLTPAVELQSVIFDIPNATATLTWSQYQGEQPFQAYRVNRRLSSETTSEVRATITNVTTTTFVDTGIEVDRAYIYSISVRNT